MIEINKVGIEIDGTVYEFYKMSFGFRRKLIEVQLAAAKLVEEVAKKNGVEPDRNIVLNSEKVSEIEKLEIGNAYLDVQYAMQELFVDKDQANILDRLDDIGVTQLIGALQ